MKQLRQKTRDAKFADEGAALRALIEDAGLSADIRGRIVKRAVALVRKIRADTDPSMMELFLGEYGLSSQEGVALMCLAEALLRVPDAETMDDLIEDKIAASQWGAHLGQSHSAMVNASTWALFMTGKVLHESDGGSVVSVLHGAIKRLGEPVIRQAVSRAMKEMGRQFVLGETIEGAMNRARGMEARGYTYSYDMLGEAARTDADARRYHMAYADAIAELAKISASRDIRMNPGISIKLSALHPRYELLQKARVMDDLMPRARALATLAKSANIGLNIDAEEAARLDLSLDLIESLLGDTALAGWDGFGVVVQAYSKRAPFVLDWLHALAERLDRRIMVRLVKGAYWDTEIKLAQVEGQPGFPVFTRKAATDVSYIACAAKLLAMRDRIYPQFATHNAHTVATVIELAGDAPDTFEFQRLHGMGEALHDTVLRRHGTRCRIYAPVGAHKDLLAYLVRRLLENGANSSFVNQIVDEDVAPEEVAEDPFALVDPAAAHNPRIALPRDLFAPERANSAGRDLSEPDELVRIRAAHERFAGKHYTAGEVENPAVAIINPATGGAVGSAHFATAADATEAVAQAEPWQAGGEARADVLEVAARLYEANADEMFALLAREAGKTIIDCIGEVREAVDFLRYYGHQARKLTDPPAGIFACISPWNFPLAIFTGQVAAALAAGNAVLAKPAEATPLIARFAVDLLHQAGVPERALHLLPGRGSEIGAALTSDPRVNGVCFTGSTETGKAIERAMAANLAPQARLIAETGGLNAMIVDSTALPEQAVRDVLASAFQSAGQRCSALRMLYVQEDIADGFLDMLLGAVDELKLGDPADPATDIGPVIDAPARAVIAAHIDAARSEGRVLKELRVPETGTFVAPTVIAVSGIGELGREVFGPVLHVARFASHELDAVIDNINATGYGLTFGVHSRIDDRVQHAIDRVGAGNIYVNRNQIGAVVGSQPFGGDGLSGTGPKAGGPLYLSAFARHDAPESPGSEATARIDAGALNDVLRGCDRPDPAHSDRPMPGPTGESNVYATGPRGVALCLGPSKADAAAQSAMSRAAGCVPVVIAGTADAHLQGALEPAALTEADGFDAVLAFGTDARAYRKALAERPGSIIPLITGPNGAARLTVEKHVCIDTTAAGGNASLLAEAGD